MPIDTLSKGVSYSVPGKSQLDVVRENGENIDNGHWCYSRSQKIRPLDQIHVISRIGAH